MREWRKFFFEIEYLALAFVSLPLLLWFAVYAGLALFLPRRLVVGIATVTGFVFADIAYNAIVGTLFFREWPQEWFFTTRLKRHKAAGTYGITRFAVLLNTLDPGHV